jgi:hypothetical protein
VTHRLRKKKKKKSTKSSTPTQVSNQEKFNPTRLIAMHTVVAHSHTYVFMYHAALSFYYITRIYILIHHLLLIEENFFLFLSLVSSDLLLLQRIEPGVRSVVKNAVSDCSAFSPCCSSYPVRLLVGVWYPIGFTTVDVPALRISSAHKIDPVTIGVIVG